MRWHIINHFIEKYNFKTYLEIGVQDINSNFSQIIAQEKTSVDPAPRNGCDYVMTSDQFFEHIDNTIPDKKWDIIFIDGLHEARQVFIDINNSFRYLNSNGIIVVHDCLPTTEQMQEEKDHGGEWTGTVWKAFVALRCTIKNIDMYTIDTDYGCGILKYGSQVLYNNGVVPEPLDWNYFIQHRREMMNVIRPDDIYII